VLYLGRGPLALAFGLLLGGVGGYLAIMSKEQYLPLALPICAILLLASASRSVRGFRRFLTARTGAASAVVGYLAIATIAYAHQDATSPYAGILHQEQAVNVIFENIVTRGGSGAVADLQALGLPASWAQYAGDGFWAPHTVYHDPLYNRYAGKLTDTNLAQFLLTHPANLFTIGQQAADGALIFRVNNLGSYSPAASQPPGALEGRVTVLDSIVGAIPTGLGLLWLLPLWAAMAAIAIKSLYRGRSLARWHRDSAFAALLLVGSAVAAFVPAAYFAGYETRHMLGTNLATALAFIFSAILLCSMIRHSIADSSASTEPENEPSVDLAATVPAPSPAADVGWAGADRL
jgi:hypothetical protein